MQPHRTLRVRVLDGEDLFANLRLHVQFFPELA
jgi:hypothetical protein